MSKKLNINQWAEEDRPREKMMTQGAAALTPAELLAILIGSGNAQEDAVSLMKRVLDSCQQSLKQLGCLSVDELCTYPGIGQAKAITILAACELGRRRAAEQPIREKISTPQQVYDYYYARICDLPTENSYVLLLNQASYIIRSVCVSSGGITETLVDIRVILREAIVSQATAIIFCHNHPSGNTTPSRQDDQLTERLCNAAKMMNIRMIDHVIVSSTGFYSYADNGKL